MMSSNYHDYARGRGPRWLGRLVGRFTAFAWMPWINNPHAVHQHYLRIGNGWEVWSSERVRGMERENEILRERALAAVDAVGHWMPAMDTCDRTTADAIRALRDVCGWKRTSPNHKDEPGPRQDGDAI